MATYTPTVLFSMCILRINTKEQNCIVSNFLRRCKFKHKYNFEQIQTVSFFGAFLPGREKVTGVVIADVDSVEREVGVAA